MTRLQPVYGHNHAAMLMRVCLQVLAGCVRCSMSAAFTARREDSEQQQSFSHPGNKALLLAQSTGSLFTLQLQHFSPSLRVLLPDVSCIAAVCLHQLFAADFLPWLKTGEHRSLCLLNLKPGLRSCEQ